MEKTKSNELIIEQVKLFIEVLDFPRQEPDGYIMNDGEVTISAVILGSDYEPGYNIVHKNPSILKDPEIVKKMEEYLIGDININTKKDTVFIDYLPMSRSEYYSNNYHDDGLSYKEYLGYF